MEVEGRPRKLKLEPDFFSVEMALPCTVIEHRPFGPLIVCAYMSMYHFSVSILMFYVYTIAMMYIT